MLCSPYYTKVTSTALILISDKFKVLTCKFLVLGFAFDNVVNISIHTILCNCLLSAVLHVLHVAHLFSENPQKKNSWYVRSLDIRGQLFGFYFS